MRQRRWSHPVRSPPRPSRARAAAQAPPAKAEKQSQPTKGEQAIVVLVNDEPVTGYEIEQRAKFIALNTNVTEQVKENFKAQVQAESTRSARIRAILDEVIRANPGKSREQIGAIFEQRKTQFAKGLQKQSRCDNARAGLMPKFKQEAQEELIEERLKLQEAKRVGIEITDDDVKRMMKTLAERNKMTEEQFAQHVKGLGVDISTMRERYAGPGGVARGRPAAVLGADLHHQPRHRPHAVRVRQRGRRGHGRAAGAEDHAADAGQDRSGRDGQALCRGRRPCASRFDGCKAMAGLAKEAGDARFEDMKFIKPSSIPEPTRSMLLSARDGDMLPPATAAAGIEIYAVCGRRAVKADEKEREKAQEELAQKEFEIVAKRHLRDLRQDAHIEYR